MSNLELSKSFQERMAERLREGFADLLSDEDLKKIIEAGIRETFFTKKCITDSYGRVTREVYPFEATIKEITNERVSIIVNEWFSENKDEVSKILDGVIRDGIVKIVFDSISSTFNAPLWNLRNEIQNVVNRMGDN